ncbi:MAG: ATP-binding protein [Pseudomonadota bacterium]
MATPEGVRAALENICATLRAQKVEEDAVGSVQMVVAEALNNIVEHALKDVAEGTIHLAMTRSDRSISFVIRDAGSPMPGHQLPPGDLPAIGSDVDAYPEGGFGWYLIRTLTSDLRYDRARGENTLSFQLALCR